MTLVAEASQVPVRSRARTRSDEELEAVVAYAEGRLAASQIARAALRNGRITSLTAASNIHNWIASTIIWGVRNGRLRITQSREDQ